MATNAAHAPQHGQSRLSRLPSLAALPFTVAGCSLTVAAAVVNVNYGLAKTADPILSIVWGTVGLSATLGLTSAIATTAHQAGRGRLGSALLSATAACLLASYSIAGALGAAHGGRHDAATTETAQRDQRARTTTLYASVDDQLGKLAPARTVGEVEPLIVTLRSKIDGVNCTKWVANTTDRGRCLQLGDLNAELARAERRTELEGQRRELATDLGGMSRPATMTANADARALSELADALGWTVSIDRVALVLSVMTVALLELGGGMLLAVAGLVGDDRRRAAKLQSVELGGLEAGNAGRSTAVELSRSAREDGHQLPVATGAPKLSNGPATCVATATVEIDAAASPAPDTAAAVQSGATPSTAADDSGAPLSGAAPTATPALNGHPIIKLVCAAGGTFSTSQRGLARLIGVDHATVNRHVAALVAAGLLLATSGRRGTVLQLAV